MKTFDRFSKIYCLNLADRTDRWQDCLKNFEEYGITNFRQFEGIKVGKGVYEENLSDKALGQIGCALSFCSMIDDAIKEDLDSVLFLEDDFQFMLPKEDMEKEVDKCLNELPKDWDMFYLGANVMNQIMDKPLVAYSKNLYRIRSGYALHSVAISKKGLKKIKACFTDIEGELWGQLMIENFEAIDVFFAAHFQ